MSHRDETRLCARCGRELHGREHFGEGGLTVIWKCLCGWASARTVPSEYGPRAEPRPLHELAAPRARISSGVQVRPVEPGGAADASDGDAHTSAREQNLQRVPRKQGDSEA
jgi:hypothetical protein